jgi:hypothetical protein
VFKWTQRTGRQTSVVPERLGGERARPNYLTRNVRQSTLSPVCTLNYSVQGYSALTIAAVMSTKRARALTNGINSSGDAGGKSRVS